MRPSSPGATLPDMARSFRPYQVIPGHPITIVVEDEAGGRAQIVGTVARVTDVSAPSTVMRMEVRSARVTPLPPR